MGQFCEALCSSLGWRKVIAQRSRAQFIVMWNRSVMWGQFVEVWYISVKGVGTVDEIVG